MTRMKSKEGAFMDCNTPLEIEQAKSKGWAVVVPEVKEEKKAPKKRRAKK